MECDSISIEELAAHPEIDTFTSVFFGRDEEPARLTPLAKRTTGRRGRIDNFGKLDKGREVNIMNLNVEINKFDKEAGLMPYSSPKRSLSSHFFNRIMKKSKN